MRVVVELSKTYYELCKVCVDLGSATVDQKILALGVPCMPIDDDFDAKELYYKTDDGGEFKLLPIKPVSEEVINTTQVDLLDELGFKEFPISIDFEVTVGQFDEFFKAIYAMQLKEEIDKSMYIICEMAKRYLYLLKEKDNEQIR